MKKRRLIIIEWDDAFGNGRWHSEDDTSNIEPMRCITVGWRMPALKGCFGIASSRDKQGKCSDRLTIPRGNIKSIRNLIIEEG